MIADIVVDLVYGDCAKGKVAHHLLKDGKYTHAIRFNGGANAGHTIFHNGKKLVTHLIPAGVFFGVKSIIGPGCVVNPFQFIKELIYLQDNGIDISNVKIAHNAHLVTDDHLAEDNKDVKIGTTKRGIGPSYRDKYARTGLRAENSTELKPYLIDFMEEMHGSNSKDNNILLEGAQGFYLDPIFGDYPYVTSSHCGVGGAIINGIPHTAIQNVYGVCKAYDTYVGAKKFEPDGDETLKEFRRVGSEFGSTTQRPRQCNYINLDTLSLACKVSAVSHLIVNKMDVLQEVNVWKVIKDRKIIDLGSENNFKEMLVALVPPCVSSVAFSYSPHHI